MSFTPYASFTAANTALTTDGGPWAFSSDSPGKTNCATIHPTWLNDVNEQGSRLIECYSNSPDIFTLNTTIAIDLTQYGGVSSLEYEWKYSTWMVGTYGRTKSTLGNNTYSNYIVTGVSTDVSGWGVPPTAVYGVTSVYTNSDRTEGYIPITITMTTGNGYSHIKGTSLRITTPITTVQLTSSTSTVTSTPVSSGPSTISAGALVGGLIGGVALGVALGVLLGLGLLFYLMKKKEERARADRQRVDEGAVPVMNPFAANDRAVHPEVQVPYAEEAPKVEETSPGPTQYAR